MTSQSSDSVCIRCGKTRIFFKKWKEVPEKGTPLIHIEYVCPDKECQKIVDAEFNEKREKRLLQEMRKTGVKI